MQWQMGNHGVVGNHGLVDLFKLNKWFLETSHCLLNHDCERRTRQSLNRKFAWQLICLSTIPGLWFQIFLLTPICEEMIQLEQRNMFYCYPTWGADLI